MREILFHGKRTDNGEWVEGYLVNKHDPLLGIAHTFILVQEVDCSCITGEPTVLKSEMSWFEVIPETVGQYTGRKDKNGTKIFEGNIVRATVAYNNAFQERVDKKTTVFEIKYREEYCFFYLARKNNNLIFDGNWKYYLKSIEIIGNIHDNPELLENGGDSQPTD